MSAKDALHAPRALMRAARCAADGALVTGRGAWGAGQWKDLADDAAVSADVRFVDMVQQSKSKAQVPHTSKAPHVPRTCPTPPP